MFRRRGAARAAPRAQSSAGAWRWAAPLASIRSTRWAHPHGPTPSGWGCNPPATAASRSGRALNETDDRVPPTAGAAPVVPAPPPVRRLPPPCTTSPASPRPPIPAAPPDAVPTASGEPPTANRVTSNRGITPQSRYAAATRVPGAVRRGICAPATAVRGIRAPVHHRTGHPPAFLFQHLAAALLARVVGLQPIPPRHRRAIGRLLASVDMHLLLPVPVGGTDDRPICAGARRSGTALVRPQTERRVSEERVENQEPGTAGTR